MEKEYKPPLDRILEELNRLNPGFAGRLTPAMVNVTAPSVFIGPGGTTNTRATLGLKAGTLPIQYFSGSILVYYNRLLLSRLLKGLIIPGSNTDYVNSQAAMTVLSDKYKLPVVAADIAIVLTTNPSTLLITARGDSLGYTGSITLPYQYTP